MPNPNPIPTVVTLPTTLGAQATTVSKQRRHYVKLAITHDDLVGEGGAIDSAKLVRLLNHLQDNVHDATLASRSSPMHNQCLIKNVTLTSGAKTTLKHSLGEPFGSAYITKAYSGAGANTVTEVPNNDGKDRSQYAVLMSNATGIYDIMLHGQ